MRDIDLIVPIGPSIAYVPLSQGQYALIEVEDAWVVVGPKWSAVRRGSEYRAVRTISTGRVYMSLTILPAPKGMITDHANGNTLDNRKHGNLREATHAQNSQNKKIPANNSTGFKGVDFVPWRNKFRARITVAGKRIELGYRDTAIEASELYEASSIIHHGAYRRAA